VEVFGPDGSATVDCTAAAGPDTYATMTREFAVSVRRDHPVRPDLDADHGLRLQQVIEAVETDLIVGE
jgi:hypothetical protein